MLTQLVILLVIALVAWVIWKYVLGAFIKDGQIMNIIGIIIGLILLIYALKMFNILPGL
jgi:hypothetical protein